MSEHENLIRSTASVCPQCLMPVPGRVVEVGGSVYLRKSCPDHGPSECLLSHHAWYYGALDRYYFSVMEGPYPQRDYLIRLTERCNLQCPICLASAVQDGPQAAPGTPDMSLDVLEEFLVRKPPGSLKVDLISAEPTTREDLPDVLRTVKRQGHIAALHTNGIRLARREYCQELAQAGMDEVFLQMDGFDDEAYMKIRGARLTAVKLRALENLETEGIATSLVMVIMPRTNEHEIPNVLEYARERSFIREVLFLGTRGLGNFRDSEDLLMPDQVIDMVEDRTGGLCSRREVFCFNKMYFALLSLLGVRKCLYVQHYILVRAPEGYRPLGDVVDWNRVEPVLDRLPSVPRRFLPRLLWALRLGASLARPQTLRYLPDFLSMLLRLRFGWKLRKLPERLLLLGYITACDPLNVDEAVARHCGKGEVAMDIGVHESGADANIDRERMWSERRAGGR